MVLAKLADPLDMAEGRYTWPLIWQWHDFLDLQDWLEWQHHAAAHSEMNP